MRDEAELPDVDLPKDLVLLMAAFRALEGALPPYVLTGAQRGVLAIIEREWPEAWKTYFIEAEILPRSVKAMERRILGT